MQVGCPATTQKSGHFQDISKFSGHFRMWHPCARRRYCPQLNTVEADGGCRRLVFNFDELRLLTNDGADECDLGVELQMKLWDFT